MRLYRSNLRVPDLTLAFPHARAMDPKVYRNGPGHLILCDPEFEPRCGYMTHDEAAVLHHAAKGIGGQWAEIGSHTGWSTAHLASAVEHVHAIDPEFARVGFNKTGDPAKFLARFMGNIQRAGVAGKVESCGITSREFFYPPPQRVYFDGVFIDGEHEPPFPENDARMILPWLKPRAVVVFHDVLGGPVQDGVRVLLNAGFLAKLYLTPQLMAVCWRGEYTPPSHEPDPRFDWRAWMRGIKFPADLADALTVNPPDPG